MRLPDDELVPDIMLPVQHRDGPGGARFQPEKFLQIAVLADAVRSFRKWSGAERRRPRRLFAEVDAWFASDDASGPFTFIAICESVGFDPEYLRRGLRQWRRQPAVVAAVARPARREVAALPPYGRVA